MSDRHSSRGKRSDNGKWVEGHLITTGDRSFIVPYFGIACINEQKNRQTDKLITLYAFEVVSETVGQCSDLPDAYGCKIFEGDRLYDERNDEWCVVEFQDGAFIAVYDGVQYPLSECADVCMVSGTIHDKIEVLEDGGND